MRDVREALKAIYAVLDKLDDRVRKCEEECRLSWSAQADRLATLDRLVDLIHIINELEEQDEAEGGDQMPAQVLLAPNGMLAVFNKAGEQLPGLQGLYTEELRWKLWNAGYRGDIELRNGWLHLSDWQP